MHVVQRFAGRGVLDMGVQRHALPDRPAEELVHGHAEHLALDVPQGDVDRAEQAGDDAARADPQEAAEDALPYLLDVRRVEPHDERTYGVDTPEEQLVGLRQRGLADAGHALVGEHLDEEERGAVRRRQVRSHIRDLHSSIPFRD